MRFVAPVHNAAEVAVLLEAGADELYCGYQDEAWRGRYGDHDSVSRRQGAANVGDEQTFEQLVAEARRLEAPLYLCVNGRYTEPQLDALERLCDRFEERGGTGLQVFDVGLLARLDGRTQLRRCLSLLAVTQNVATIAAYRALGVDRVVFPRFLGPAQIAELLAPFPGLEGEFMALFDRCPFIDGYCRFYHGTVYADAAGQAQFTPAAKGGMRSGSPMARGSGAGCDLLGAASPVSPQDQSTGDIYRFDTCYQTHSCITLLGAPANFFPCAACALDDFEAAGARYAKLGGRGTPLEHRARGLRFLRAAQQCASDRERRELYRSVFDSDCNCYYYGTRA